MALTNVRLDDWASSIANRPTDTMEARFDQAIAREQDARSGKTTPTMSGEIVRRWAPPTSTAAPEAMADMPAIAEGGLTDMDKEG